jgi:hypothetical protein
MAHRPGYFGRIGGVRYNAPRRSANSSGRGRGTEKIMPQAFGAIVLDLSWPGGSWQTTVKIVAAVVITYLVVLWVAGLVWTYRDIRDRTRDPFYQAAAVFLVLAFNLPGFWLYRILRPKMTLADAYERTLEEEALLQDLEEQKGCPTCHRRVQDDFVVCPACTTQLKEPCVKCGKPLSYAWVACPYCATPRRNRALTPGAERGLPAGRVEGTSTGNPFAQRGEDRTERDPAPSVR